MDEVLGSESVAEDLAIVHTPLGAPLTTTHRVISYTYPSTLLFDLARDEFRTGDAVGNRLSLTTHEDVVNYGYDDANRLTSVNGQAYTWDANGNLLSDGLRSYTYDHANRLVQVVSGTLTTQFTYNGAGDRVAKTVDGVTTDYVLDGSTGLTTGPAAGLTQVLQETTGGQTTRYLYGHDLLAQYDSGTWAYHVNDGLGSVRQLADPTGQVVQSYSFSPFGVPLGESGGQPYGYTGEQWDASTGLVYLRVRYYDVGTGRFISKDPLSGFVTRPQSLNRWVYVQNNPVNRRDPTGLREDEGCDRCGPNIDDWFLEEIKIHWDWVRHEKVMFDQVTAAMGATDPVHREVLRQEREGVWILQIKDYLKALPYKWMNFSDLVSGCPSSVLCRNTLTLCDTCLERSELGNIMFGFSSQVAGFSNLFTFWAGHNRAKGLQKPWDQAAAGIGYYFGQYNLVPLHSDTMCRIFRSSTGAWKHLPMSQEPAPWEWKYVQDACIRMCEPCTTPIPASTPHTKPAYAGEAAGKSWFAGAPKYIYYTEQIPEGMLDPLLIRYPLEEEVKEEEFEYPTWPDVLP